MEHDNSADYRSTYEPRGFDSLSLPTYRGSTITFADYRSFMNRSKRHRSAFNYGLNGTPTTRALQSRLCELEGAYDTFLAPSGLMAITTVLLATSKSGDKVLLPDTVYAPVKRFADGLLARMGMTIQYYDPLEIAEDLLDDDSISLIWVEMPASFTMEILDLNRIIALARSRGIVVACDNSWATPFFCRPLELGADIVVEAVTKYLSGHSDLLLGSISVKDETTAIRIHECIKSLGLGVSPDDCFLAYRGIQTAGIRLKHIEQSAMILAEFLSCHDAVSEVLHPALPKSRYHDLWRSQFSGASGLFSFILKEEDESVFERRFERLSSFRIGASWGGNHSLVAPWIVVAEQRRKRQYRGNSLVRVSVGLEDTESLVEDMDNFLS